MITTGMTRKRFLGGALAAGALAASGCDVLATDPDSKDGDGKRPTGGDREAPQLAELVKAGKLPPRSERLPDTPLVVQPAERIGVYGGSWRTALVGGEDQPWLQRTINWEGIVRHNAEFDDVLPNVAESLEINDDATEFVFRLRRGMKWSDGEPFTADDIMFWYEGYFMNEELTPVKDTMFVSGGEPLVVSKVDDYTVSFTFAAPNGLYEQYLGGGRGDEPVKLPRHYLEQFHPDYNPDGIDALVEESGREDWVQLFLDRADWAINPDIPTLHAWNLTAGYQGTGNRLIASRNPYYWKVDPDGNQLPYLDEVVFSVIENNETVLLNALNGELDMHSRHINTAENKPVLSQSREKGQYDFFDLLPDIMNVAMFSLNLTHEDPVKREVYQNLDFRIGLSYAINRQEIIDVVYREQGEPWQGGPGPESPFYNERLAKQYTEYDVDRANEHLDRAGYTERDGDGFRLGPDGNRIKIIIDVTVEEGPEWVNVVELVVGYWRAVGIDTSGNTIARSLADTRKDSNAVDLGIQPGFGGISVLTDPRWYFPWSGNEHAVRWVEWYESGGNDGEEPPAAAREQMALYDELRVTPDAAGREALMREILEISADQFYAIGISYPANGYGIVRRNFYNVPAQMYTSTGATYPEPAPTNPCQYFIE